MRLKTCRERIMLYLRGEEACLPELEEELLDFWGGFTGDTSVTPTYNHWGLTVTSNQLN